MVGYWFSVKVGKKVKTSCFTIADNESACMRRFRQNEPTANIYGMIRMSENEIQHYTR